MFEDWEIDLLFLRLLSLNLLLSQFELHCDIVWHSFITEECPSVDAIAFASREHVAKVLTYHNLTWKLQMAGKGLLRRGHLTAQEIVVHSQKSLLASRQDVLAVQSNREICALLVRQSVMFPDQLQFC